MLVSIPVSLCPRTSPPSLQTSTSAEVCVGRLGVEPERPPTPGPTPTPYWVTDLGPCMLRARQVAECPGEEQWVSPGTGGLLQVSRWRRSCSFLQLQQQQEASPAHLLPPGWPVWP